MHSRETIVVYIKGFNFISLHKYHTDMMKFGFKVNFDNILPLGILNILNDYNIFKKTLITYTT